MTKYIMLDEVDSTNSYLMNGNFSNGTVVVCLNQTAGKGRSGRKWQSNPGSALALSWQLPNIAASKLLGLQIALGFAVVDALVEYADIRLKWPNDILYHGRKLCGMLIESKLSGNSINKAVFGVGVNLRKLPAELANTAACMEEFCDVPVSELIDKIIESLRLRFDEYINGELNLTAEWAAYSAFYMKPLAFHRNGDVINVTEEGIASDGRLLIRNASGGREVVTEGEIGYGFGI